MNQNELFEMSQLYDRIAICKIGEGGLPMLKYALRPVCKIFYFLLLF